MISRPPVLIGYQAIPLDQWERIAAVVRAAVEPIDGELVMGIGYMTNLKRVAAALTADDIEAVSE